MAAKTDFSTFNCSLARALGVVGDGWSMLILRDAFLGRTRFGEFVQGLGVAKNILADRLDRLVAAGVFERTDDARPAYALTEMGRALLPALIALAQWGDEWISDAAPMVFTDADGRSVETVELRAGGKALDPANFRVSPGPGADPRTQAFLSSSSRS